MGHSFEPKIVITVTSTEVRVVDNGVGMTRRELEEHFWRAGASGKNNPEARAAGVVGTFGIGAMANFGVASKLTVISESANDGHRIYSSVARDSLSVTEKCIDLEFQQPTGSPGTTVIAEIPADTPISISDAFEYISGFVRFLEIPVIVNEHLVSQKDLDTAVPKPSGGWEHNLTNATLGSQIKANIELAVAKTGEVWLRLTSVRYSDKPIDGIMILRQGTYQIQTFHSRFGLAMAAVSSLYSFGGIADLGVLEPTAGREALTTSSLGLLQNIIAASEEYVSEKLAETTLSNLNTSFMQWVSQHRRFELCSKLSIRLEPDIRSITLGEIKTQSKEKPFNCYQGSDQSFISQYATDDQPLIVISTSTPRKKCELGYLQSYCNVRMIEDTPTVLRSKPERDWTLAESAFALRMISILESDYFVKVLVKFGKISHNLPLLVDTSRKPLEIVLDSDSTTVAMMLKMYDADFSTLTGMVKDYVRNVIFPKIANFVPSSTRQGAEAFLRAIRRPRDIFEYGKSDIGNLTEIWQDYLDGKIKMDDAARQSVVIVRRSVQVVDRAVTKNLSDVIPDVLDNQMVVGQTDNATKDADEFEPLPAITRLEKEAQAKLLTISEDEKPLNGYRCFVAVSDRMREEFGAFFLQPHRTEIVWGGQKALYIFPHHSGEFSLYYDLQSTELLSNIPGGRAFKTSTIVLKNQIYIPIPDEISQRFIPQESGKKRFEIRFELLYPETGK
jgi:molecular chaperone HtpG